MDLMLPNYNLNSKTKSPKQKVKLVAQVQIKIKFNFIKNQYHSHSNLMDIRDFEGIYHYKLILPAMYIVSWVCMFLGPSLFPVVYQAICFGVVVWMALRLFTFGFINFVLLVENCRILSRAQKNQQINYQQLREEGEQILHGFIIPSYKQDIELIAETLSFLSKHKRAKQSYFVFLAMEKHEQGADKKAETIIERFRTKFRHIDYTLHEVRQYEQKGKASNVSWCAEHLEEKFKKMMTPTENLFLTIIDVDSWAPDVYFDEVEDHVRQNWEERHIFIYQPPQMFTRNHLEVPVVSRVYDYMHSSMHAANLFSFSDITFPLSNYSLSFNLAKRMGFWDTVEEAIGEDFHTTQKAIWKTRGEAKAVPIYAPFNQLNLATGSGYLADLEARFWQAERHARGLGDIPYTIHMLIKQPFNWRTFWMAMIVFQIFFLPAFVPWVFISLTYQSQILYKYTKASPQLISEETLGYLFNILTIGSVITFGCFQIVKRRSTKILFNLENESIFRLIELAIFYLPNVFFITLPVMIIAAFGSLKGNREYVVADKVSTRKQIA